MKIFISTLIALSLMTSSLMAQDRNNANAWLKSMNIKLRGALKMYDYERYNQKVHSTHFEMAANGKGSTQWFEGTKWKVTCSSKLAPGIKDAVDLEVVYEIIEGESKQTAPCVIFEVAGWSTDNYVLFPAAAYNGNRFESRRLRYSPKLLDPRDVGPDKPTIVSDIPRLNINDGPSRIQERTGSMTVPAMGFQSPDLKKGFWLTTPLSTRLGDTGMSIEESRNRKTAYITLTAPVVRELYKYRITDMRYPSDDKAPDFKQGDKITLKARVYISPAKDIQALYDRFFSLRKDQVVAQPEKNILPLSAAYKAVEEKFNRTTADNGNWVDEHGYYAVGIANNFLQDWQIGWTGGMISTLPLLSDGTEQSKERVVKAYDWLFPDGICPSGFFWDSGEKGTKWYGGDIRKPTTKDWHLTRKSGDGLYYIVKQFFLMKANEMEVKEEWSKGTQGVADAFVKLWESAGQFGNFIDSQTGEIAVGGSTSGAIVPGALALSSKYYNNPKYLDVAKASAEYYYQNFVKKGLTTGGPGDAMQAPDSESAYALVESFTVLHEVTGEQKWMDYATQMATQFSTWVIAYDYPFPKSCLFGKLDIRSTGSVNANAQNKHGSPGICTHSGIGLLKIYRATGDVRYLQMLKEIVHNAPQYVAHPDKPISDLPYGWMSERVSTTDWLEGIGEIVRHTTWAETALMLMYTEVPGLYVEPDQSKFTVMDHIVVKKTKDSSSKLTLTISNPTKSEAKVKVLAENTADKKKNFDINPLSGCEEIVIPVGGSITKSFKKK